MLALTANATGHDCPPAPGRLRAFLLPTGNVDSPEPVYTHDHHTPNAVVLASDVVTWLRRNPQIKRLNIAGNRQSKNPGNGERVEQFLRVVFKRLNERADS
jgi:hypothetical protein